jgi:uncharacterized protein
MLWYNEPAKWSADGSTITVTTDAKTDFWRITHYGFIRDNGHVYAQEIKGDFTASVKIIGAYRDLYDQAGLMLRIDDKNWIKCGIELVESVQQASVVVTREFSDWSVLALPQNPPALWLRVTRSGDAVEVHFSLDGSTYTLMRVAYFPALQPVHVGVMCCSPEGQGFEVRFEDFQLGAP